MNIEVHVSFSISVFVFSDIYPAVELLGRMVVPFVVFEGTSILFSAVAASIYIPVNSAQVFSLVICLQTLVICVLLLVVILTGTT